MRAILIKRIVILMINELEMMILLGKLDTEQEIEGDKESQ